VPELTFPARTVELTAPAISCGAGEDGSRIFVRIIHRNAICSLTVGVWTVDQARSGIKQRDLANRTIAHDGF
jgi:hypothetical protein